MGGSVSSRTGPRRTGFKGEDLHYAETGHEIEHANCLYIMPVSLKQVLRSGPKVLIKFEFHPAASVKKST